MWIRSGKTAGAQQQAGLSAAPTWPSQTPEPAGYVLMSVLRHKEGNFVRKGAPSDQRFTRLKWLCKEHEAVENQALRFFLSLHSLLKVYQSQPELAMWVILSQPSHVYIILLCSIEGLLRHCLWGLFSVSWKEGMKLNDLGKCVVGEGGSCQVVVPAAKS